MTHNANECQDVISLVPFVSYKARHYSMLRLDVTPAYMWGWQVG